MRDLEFRRARTIALLLSLLLAASVITGCRSKLNGANLVDSGNSNPLAFETIDVNDKPVRVGYPSNSVVVVFFSGQATSDAMQPVTADIAVHFREQSGIDFVTVVDLRTLAFYERPFADRAIRDAGARTIRRVNRQLDQMELPPIEGLEDHLFLINDLHGELTDVYGVPDPNQELTCIVYDPAGGELGRWDPAVELEQVIEAIERSLQMLAQSQHQH